MKSSTPVLGIFSKKVAALSLHAVLGVAAAHADIIWLFHSGLRQWYEEDHDASQPCVAAEGQCCRPAGEAGGGGGGPGYGPGVFPGAGGGCNGCPAAVRGAAEGPGMPRWWVSEPLGTLWLEDVPMWYQPSRGPSVQFRLRFKNVSGGQNLIDFGQTNIFSFGPGWHCPWRSYLQISSSHAILVNGEGSIQIYTLGTSKEYHTQTTLEAVSTNYVLSFPSGEKHTYSYKVTQSSVDTYFLTQITDPASNTSTLEYEVTNNVVRLKRVLDVDAREITFAYTNTGIYPMLVSKVIGPFGLTNLLSYNDSGKLSAIQDVLGMTSTMNYTNLDLALTWKFCHGLTNLVTPYGTTTFAAFHDASSGDEATYVDEMGISKHFYSYLDFDLYSRLPTDFSGDKPAIAAEIGESFDASDSHKRNSFYWSPRLFEQLSDNVRTNLALASFEQDNLTSQDFVVARQRHWLLHTGLYKDFATTGDPVSQAGDTLAFERSVSPDGTTDGQLWWYDHPDKPADDYEGSQIMPCLAAWNLPNGQSHYTYFARNSWGHPTNVTETYSSGGSVLLRTNLYTYAANQIDLLRHLTVLGSSSKQVSSNWFNSNHQVLTNLNVLNEVTISTYDGSNRLTSVLLPSGLFTTNVYDSDGRLASATDSESGAPLRTNSWTYTNGLVRTHADPRGLTVTKTYDKLGRLTKAEQSNGAITYTYDKLDIVQVVDRMGVTNQMQYDALRRKTREFIAIYLLNRTNSYAYCNCGSLDAMTNAVGEVTLFSYDNLGRLTRTQFADSYSLTNFYDLTARLVAQGDSGGWVGSNSFNNQGLVVATTNALGQVSKKAFDIEDMLISSVDAAGVM